MKLDRSTGVLLLHINTHSSVTFRDEWVAQLRALPYEKFGDFMRDTIYPSLSVLDRKTWHRSTINNCDLQAAVQALS